MTRVAGSGHTLYVTAGAGGTIRLECTEGMNDTTTALPAEAGGYETTRFNALRHGVLSRYTVLPWEDEGEYRVLLDALVAEHAPQGPTEEHLVEELGRYLMAQAAATPGRGCRVPSWAGGHAETLPRDGEGGAGASRRDAQFEKVIDAIRATPAETTEHLADLEENEAMTRRALDLLGPARRMPRRGADRAARGQAPLVGGGGALPRPR
jgi:hypothetical protein